MTLSPPTSMSHSIGPLVFVPGLLSKNDSLICGILFEFRIFIRQSSQIVHLIGICSCFRYWHYLYLMRSSCDLPDLLGTPVLYIIAAIAIAEEAKSTGVGFTKQLVFLIRSYFCLRLDLKRRGLQ